ncbi:hypothetical protein [Dyella japonica]|uniref:Uncharacterized protein n=1 Tax=Dyella japonica TaxID=231455 RepID=A0ABV2JUK9_9GAMM
MDNVRQMAAMAALNKMLRQGHFSVSVVRDIASMFDIVPDPEAMAILKPLHCVDYAEMPRELYAALPGLVQKALSGSPIFQFELKHGPEPLALAAGAGRGRGLFRKLLGGADG